MSPDQDRHVSNTIAYYDATAMEYADKIKGVIVPELNKFMKLLPTGGTVLDLGCGSGRDAGIFSSHGFKVVGVDLSERLLDIAELAVPQAVFRVQDIRDLDFQDNSFDGVWSLASLLHLKREEIEPVLVKLRQILKPNGVLFIEVKQGSGEMDVEEKNSTGSRHFTYFELEEF